MLRHDPQSLVEHAKLSKCLISIDEIPSTFYCKLFNLFTFFLSLCESSQRSETRVSLASGTIQSSKRCLACLIAIGTPIRYIAIKQQSMNIIECLRMVVRQQIYPQFPQNRKPRPRPTKSHVSCPQRHESALVGVFQYLSSQCYDQL